MKRISKWGAAALSAVTAAAALSLNVFAEETASTAETGSTSTWGALLSSLLPFVIALALLYLILLRPQQKREKEAQAMRENVRVGDEVCTAGGLVGIVIRVTDDTVVLETGGERSKIRVKKWAIHENITQMEEKAAAEKERKAAKRQGIAVAGADTEKPEKKKKKQEPDVSDD